MAAKPVHEVRRGLIVVKIWRKRSRQQIRHTTSVARLFRNGDRWQQSTRFTSTDIPLLRIVLDEAHSWILRQETGEQL